MTKTTGQLKNEAKDAIVGKRISSMLFLIFCILAVQLVNYIISYFPLKSQTYDIVVACAMVLLGFPFFASAIKYFLIISRGEKKKISKIFSPFDRSYMTLVYFSFMIYAVIYAVNYVTKIGFEDSAITTILSFLKWIVYITAFVYTLVGSFVIADSTDVTFPVFLRYTNWYVKKTFFKVVKVTFSFIGWFILCLVTFGIALFWVIPYYAVTLAKVYDNADFAEPEEEPEVVEEVEEEPAEDEEETLDSVTRDLSQKQEETVFSPDETVVFTKEMLEKIKKSGKND